MYSSSTSDTPEKWGVIYHNTLPELLLSSPGENSMEDSEKGKSEDKHDNNDDGDAPGPTEITKVMDDEDIYDNFDERAVEAAMAYANTRSNTMSARRIAERVHLTDWTKAAEVWGIRLGDLRDPPGGRQIVEVPEAARLSPKYGLFPHQVPGTTQLLERALGPLGGCLLADEMGLGKTNVVLGAFYLNYVAVLRSYAPSVYRKVFPEGTFPGMSEDGKAWLETRHVKKQTPITRFIKAIK
ncbi:hypothetical protein COCVIDRAFT_11241 [Bipolaris victoriae FI3]|uniref:SNF2 N-terminal domain-containing protein n=1 Tax=Bipolaris victoriae (strain FI3) TaxID=930091 RepID=W7EXB3_BIPV3|nr:hypothetical protein COCVIDRAFT_11241 [Bipolaris victoriae FI3]